MIKKALFLLIIPASLCAQKKDTVALRFSNLVTAGAMSRNLHVLASDAYEGRETGRNGQKMAAAYIAEQFRLAGVPAYKDSSYFQKFPLNLIAPGPADITVNGKKYAGNKDYYNFPGPSETTFRSNQIIFLGYGIEEDNYNDYAGKDVQGKAVMIFAGEPYGADSLSLISGKKKPSLWTTYYKLKPEKAREKGVAVLFIVVDDIAKNMAENKHRLESPSMKLGIPSSAQKQETVVIYISREMASAILKKQKPEKLRAEISKSRKPLAKEIHASLLLSIRNTGQEISSENVLGYVEGSDLKNELVVITAHYDHLGKEGDIVFNGADDDGSGTVAVISLAEAFARAKKEGKGPRRSMLFMTVAGEEKGLLGSAYYTENPVFPLENTVCDLNIDMIGRLDEKHAADPNYIYIIGSDKLSSELHAINEEANRSYTGLELDYTYNDEKDKNRFYYRSDHYNFAKKGIPVIFYFNGVHADYHRETDEVEKIDFVKMEKISRLVFFTAWELANRDGRIKVDSHKK